MTKDETLKALLEIEEGTEDDELRKLIAIVYSAVGLEDLGDLYFVVRMWAGSRIADLVVSGGSVEHTRR